MHPHKDNKRSKILMHIMFDINENLFYMLFGVFVAACINLLTTVFTTEYSGTEKYLFLSCTVFSIYAVIAFGKLTSEVIRIRTQYKSTDDIDLVRTAASTRVELYSKYGKRTWCTIINIAVSSLLFLITLLLGWLSLNSFITICL